MMGGFSDYDKYDGLGLAGLVRKGEVRPIDLVEEAISRIERLNPQLNAVIHKMYDRAREAAEGTLPEGPFRGVPFLLKDVVTLYAGEPMRSGSRFLRDFVPDHDSELVLRLKAAGLVFLGKTNVPEMGLLPTTEPELFGPTRNPWDPGRTPGGSSGGAAAAVAARMVPLAHGNDGGGSIRIPASCCGLFGFKPTRGRTPLGPDVGEVWHGLTCEHALTLSVRDSAALLDATAGPDVGAPYYAPPPLRPFLEEVGQDPGRLRIAFTTKPFLGDAVHEDCVKGLEETVRLCRDLGHEMVEAAPEVDKEPFAEAFLTLVAGNLRADIEAAEALVGRKARAGDFEPATWALALMGGQIPASKFSASLRLLQQAARRIGRFFEEYDVLLTPTLASPPLPLGALHPEPVEMFAMRLLGRLGAGRLLDLLGGIRKAAQQSFSFVPYTPLANVTGQPAMSVPLYWSDEGLPIGMHFMGRYGDEATLFRLAGQLERARPWFDRRPPICG